MSKSTLAAGTSPFAHLLSGFRGAKRAEDDKDDKTKGKRAEDETPPDEEGQTDPEDANDPENVDDPEDVEEGARRGKRARKAQDDDQDPEADAGDDDDDREKDMDDKEAKAFRRGLAAGRVRENARASRIFSNAAAAGRPDLAAVLAFTTRNSSAEAARLMGVAGAAPTPRGRSLDDRMGARSEARPGTGSGAAGKPSFAERVAAAAKKAGR